MSVATISDVAVADHQVLEVLRVSGFQLLDGWFYPAGDPDRAVVRLGVSDGNYEIWRRRRLRSPWLRIVAARTAEFDLAAFERWRQDWPLTR